MWLKIKTKMDLKIKTLEERGAPNHKSVTSTYCKVWVKSAQVSFLSLWKLTGPPQVENNQWKKKTQHFSQKTALVSIHLPARISSQDHDKSSSAIPQNILTAAPDVWLTLFKASLSESFPYFGRTHSLHGSLKSSQGLAHNTYTGCQNTQLISQIYIWNLSGASLQLSMQ